MDNTGAKLAIMAAKRAAVLPLGPATAEGKVLVKAANMEITARVISAAAETLTKKGLQRTGEDQRSI